MVAQAEKGSRIEGIKLSPGSQALSLTDDGLAACQKRLGLEKIGPRVSPRTLGLVAGEVLGNMNLSAVLRDNRITDLVP